MIGQKYRNSIKGRRISRNWNCAEDVAYSILARHGSRTRQNIGGISSTLKIAITNIHCHFGTPLRTSTMGYPFDYAPDRPEHIDAILNGLDRYNPETTAVFQDYVMQQCENQTYDCYANLALLKLYVLYFMPSPNLQGESAL